MKYDCDFPYMPCMMTPHTWQQPDTCITGLKPVASMTGQKHSTWGHGSGTRRPTPVSFSFHCMGRNKSEKRSAWTCWGSGVKFSHGSTSGRWRSYDRTNSLRTPTMKENQLFREKTTSTCSNAVHAQFHWLAYTRNSRPCDVVCLKSKHFRSIAGMIAPHVHLRDRRETW